MILRKIPGLSQKFLSLKWLNHSINPKNTKPQKSWYVVNYIILLFKPLVVIILVMSLNS